MRVVTLLCAVRWRFAIKGGTPSHVHQKQESAFPPSRRMSKGASSHASSCRSAVMMSASGLLETQPAGTRSPCFSRQGSARNNNEADVIEPSLRYLSVSSVQSARMYLRGKEETPTSEIGHKESHCGHNSRMFVLSVPDARDATLPADGSAFANVIRCTWQLRCRYSRQREQIMCLLTTTTEEKQDIRSCIPTFNLGAKPIQFQSATTTDRKM